MANNSLKSLLAPPPYPNTGRSACSPLSAATGPTAEFRSETL
ncbi:hypothetical protein QUB63_04505 [Microcoleus sp. ARI1-B5]